MSIFQFECKKLDGRQVIWSDFKGKKILLVNTASECGFTAQYAQLQDLYAEFGGDKFTVIGVPSNDFGGQEPGTEKQIQDFCTKNYGVTFPLLEKMPILGAKAHPLMQYLQEKVGQKIEWNFSKFLIDGDGLPLKMLSSAVDPCDEQIMNWINE